MIRVNENDKIEDFIFAFNNKLITRATKRMYLYGSFFNSIRVNFIKAHFYQCDDYFWSLEAPVPYFDKKIIESFEEIDNDLRAFSIDKNIVNLMGYKIKITNLVKYELINEDFE